MKFPGFTATGPVVDAPTGSKFGTVGDIVTNLLPYVFAIAGLILFFTLIWGGFTLLTSAGNPENVKKGQALLTSSIIGFIIIFISYWLMVLLQIAFGAKFGF